MKRLDNVWREMVDLRHELHKMPEIAGQEFKTMRMIRDRLAKLDLEVLPPFLETDTVAILRGARPGKNLTLRADIDALTIEEKTGCPYASTVPGMMHACGHDAHTSMLMGAAEILCSMKDEIKGTIRFVWQPGEENAAMAKQLIAAGALDDPKPDMVAAIHMSPGTPVGMMRVCRGASEAACTHFKITFRGKGGHGSLPHASRSPLTAAAFAVVEAQSIVPNRLNPHHAGVISICCFNSGTLHNIIPGEAVLQGTIRSFDAGDDEMLSNALREICEGAAKMHRVECDVELVHGYLPVINTPAETEMAILAAKRAGLEVGIPKEPSMVSEDFSFFLTKAPGVMIKLGNGKDSPGLHTPSFDASDEAMRYGISWLVELAKEFSATRA